MKRILITGTCSYIGTSLKKWLENYPDKYHIDTLNMISESWKSTNFSNYDVLFHVAGIAHIRETKRNAHLYYTVNRDLAYETAQKAKKDGVKQFIFLSSMSVYGIDNGVIDKNTPLKPKSNYGKSKLQAEKLISSLEDDTFKIAILRPPMVYGKGCKGNYLRLAKYCIKTPFFPYINNKRSMIYIDNLCEFVRLLIDNCSSGLFFPQNKEYVCTSEMVKIIAECHGKKIHLTKIFNPLIRRLNISLFNKLFGDLVYEKELSIFDNEYIVCSFIDSIRNTEVD